MERQTLGKRTKARECALQMLYQWDITREPMDRVAGLFWQVRTQHATRRRPMAERLARGAQAEVERLDEAIARGLDQLALRAHRGHRPQHPAHRRLRADAGAGRRRPR